MPTDDLDPFCCQDPECDAHDGRGEGNILAIDRYGKEGRRLLYCRTSKSRFSETKGTPFFNSKLPPRRSRPS